ncbi:GNAT family N-acetyltransferase [Neobacillus dielmonensis]|uniref:GNAT family N-acetyltransferase n=1 Tax=Neobacillus dielmonensis TaxID=1347369 RepID=UPI0005AB0C75|nr:GNAT family N-acetyltransferase [Neobacillus dielmonensis]
MPMYFEEIKKDTLYIALEIINTNQAYNIMENGHSTRSFTDMESEFLNSFSQSKFIKLDDTYIGVLDYLEENPNDQFPWLGVLMIHADYQGFGFGEQAYALFENEMIKRGFNTVRIGVIKENLKAKQFWEKLGFIYYNTTMIKNEIEILCYQKQIKDERH